MLRLPEQPGSWIAAAILVAAAAAAVHLAVWPSWPAALLCVSLSGLLAVQLVAEKRQQQVDLLAQELSTYKQAFAEGIGTAFAKGYAAGVERSAAGPKDQLH